MVENIKLYKPNSYPLQEFKEDEIVDGSIGYTNYGVCFKAKKLPTGGFDLEQIHPSVLYEGACIDDFETEDTWHILKSFWALSNKELNKYI